MLLKTTRTKEELVFGPGSCLYLHHPNQHSSSWAKMIQLLFTLVMIEIAFILILSFANPIRKLVIKGLDLWKQGRGPLVTKTVAATLIVVFGSTVYTITKLQKRSKDAGMVNPTDEVLMAQRLLEASLMGVSLFLGLVIDRQHYYMREIISLRKNLETGKKLNHNHEQLKRRGGEETEMTGSVNGMPDKINTQPMLQL